ncbi:hypothetical protein GH714_008577 [Hevea brasiliensis]|uniref:Secreted protein n=1 Tax=Hevea brasiliensis TaxID=3981 RepID=A0A6A6MX78_HEVBR|nr:hypothetical protein GH714_008577 [Hevea brasiliensis]
MLFRQISLAFTLTVLDAVSRGIAGAGLDVVQYGQKFLSLRGYHFWQSVLGTRWGKAPLFKKGYRNVTDEAIRLIFPGIWRGSAKILGDFCGFRPKGSEKLLLTMKGVSGYGGWFLLRLSLHDPVLPLNIEAPSDEDAVELGLSVASAVKEFAAMTHLPWTNLSNHFKSKNSKRCWVFQKFHHEVEFDIWRGHRLRPVCSFWHLNTFETLAFVQFCGSGIVQVTMQSNGTTSPAPGLSLCLCYKSLGYPLPPEYLPNCNIRYVCNSSPGRNMQVPLARI